MPDKSSPKLISIQEAANLLRVSTKTIRRWEAKGVLLPSRTPGGHRRYLLSHVTQFKKQKGNRRITSKILDRKDTGSLAPLPEKARVPIDKKLAPLVQIKKVKNRPNKVAAKPIKQVALGLAIMFLFSLTVWPFLKSNIFNNLQISIPTNQIKFAEKESKAGVDSLKKEIVSKKLDNNVLAASSFDNISFNVNVDSFFRDDATFERDVAVNAGSITTSATEANLFNASATTLNIGGEATSVNLGSSTATLTIGDTLASPGDLTIDPTGQDVTVDGNMILSDTFTTQVGGKTGTTYNAFANAADAPEQSAISSDNDLYIGGDLEVDGAIYGDGSNLTGISTYSSWTFATNGTSRDTITSGDILNFVQGTGLSISRSADDTLTFSFTTDGLNFTEFSDTLTLDAATSITNSLTGNLTIDLTSTGDFAIQDNSTTYVTFTDTGTVEFADGSLLDLANITHNDTALQGIRLPQAASFTSPSSGEGLLAWDTDDDALAYFDGSAWNTITGGGVTGSGVSGRVTFWTSASAIGSDGTFFYDDTNDLLGIGTGSPTSQLHITGTYSTNPLVLVNETGGNDILQAQSSGSTVARITNAGNILLTGTLNTESGNLTIDSAGGTTTIADIVNLGSSGTGVNITAAGIISDIDGNLVLNDTVDIGSTTTGIRVTTAGAISDIDGNLAINDNTDLTGNLDVNGTLTAATGDAFQVNASGQITAATDETINGIDISAAAAVSDVASLALAAAGNSWTSAGNLTLSGDLAVNGGDITTTLTGLNVDVADTGTIYFRDGTNNLFTISDEDSYGIVALTTAASQPGTCTEGELYADANNNLYYCETTNTWIDLTDSGGSVSGSGTSGQVSFWTGASSQSGSNEFFWDNTNNLLGIQEGSPIHVLEVDGGYQGNALVALNETLGNDILVASQAGTTVARITNAGNILLTGTLNTVSGNLTIDSAGGQTSISDNLVVTGTSDLQGVISNSAGNVILGDTIDIGSTTTGIRVTTAGAISDIDGDVTITDNVDAQSGLDVTGANLTVGASNFTVAPGSGNITTAGTLSLPNSNSLTGVASYIQANNGLSVGGGTTYYFDSSGNLNANQGTFAATLDANGQVDLGDGGDPIAISGTTVALTSNAATNDITLTSADDIIFDDLQLGSAIQMTVSDSSLPNSNTGIVDAINDAWDAAIGAGGGTWTLDSGTIYPTTITNNVGIGTTTPADIESKLFVTNDSTATGKAVAIFDQDESEDIISASASGNSRLTLTNAGNLQFHQASSITTTTGNLTLDSASSTVFADDLSWTATTPTLSITDGGTITVNDGSNTLMTLADAGSDGNLTVTGDVAVNGADLTSSAATFNLLNATPTTINFGSAATAMNIADAAITGTIDIGGVTADGTTTVNIATEGTSADTISIGNSNAATTLTLTGGDDWSMAATGVLTMSASAAQTTAIVVTDTDYTNALSIGTNNIIGTTGDIDLTNFDVTGSSGNITTAGDLAVNGGDITTTATTWNLDLPAASGTIYFRDGTNNLFSIADQGDYPYLSVAVDTSALDTTCTEGQIHANTNGNIYYCESTDSWVDLTPGAAGVTAGGTPASGQVAYWTSSSEIAGNSDFYWNNSSELFGLGTAGSPISKLHVSDTVTGKALVIFDDEGTDQNIFTASASGTTVMNLDRNGNLSFINQADARFYDSDESNYSGFQAPSNLTSDILYTLPTGTFTEDYVLTWQTGNVMEWKEVSGVGGAGDITYVGDVSSGAAFAGADSGNNLWFEGTSADGFEVQLTAEDPTYDALITFPAETGEVALIQPDAVQTATKSGSILWFNETNAGSPNLVELEVGGTDTFTVQNDGDIVTVGDIAINGGNITSSVDLDINATGDDITTPDRLTVGSGTAGVGQLNVTGTQTGKALVILNDTGTDQNILTASASGTTVFNLDRDGDLNLANSEYIGNATDDVIAFVGVGGGDDTDLYLNLDGTYPTLYSNTDTQVGLDDDLIFVGAQQITTSTGDLTLTPTGNLVINTTGGTVDINDGIVDIATQATDIEIADNTANALTISQGSDNYFAITTTDDQESLTLDLPAGGGTSLTANLFTSNIAKTINLGTGTAADIINIGTGDTSADDINLGGLATSTIDILGITDIGDGGTTNYARFSATGDLTFAGTADTITGPSTDLFTITNAGDTTLSVTGAGNDLLISASDEIDLTSTGLTDINAGANLDIDVTGTYDILASSTFSIDGTGASNVTATSGNLTLSTLTSGTLILNSAGAMDIDSAGALTIDTAGSGDITITSADDIILDDAQIGGTIQVSDADGSFTSGDTGIIDAINVAYNAAIGAGGGIWTLDTGTVYPTTITNNVGVGTTTAANIESKLFVTNDSTATGKAVAIFDQTEDQDIIAASDSGATRLRVAQNGNLFITGTLNTVSGNLTLDSSGGTTTIADNLVVTGTSDLQGNISDSGGNLILDDTVDIGSATTGIRVTTAGAISDIDGNLAINDNTDLTGNLDISGTLIAGTGDAFQVDATGNISSSGTTGITLSGADADFTFSGSGNHDITASSGTLRLGAATLTGTIAGGSQDVDSLGSLDFGTGNVNITGTTVGLTTDTDLLSLATNVLTVNGDVRLADTYTLEVGGLTSIAYNAFADATDSPDEAAIAADNDLYIGGDLEVDGTLYSNSVSGSYTQGSVIFAGASGVLAEDNNNFFWNDTGNLLGLGDNTPESMLDIEGAIVGQALVQLNETGDQDVLAASVSGTTVARISNSGNIFLTGTINTVSGNLTIDSVGGTTTIDDAVNLGSSSTGVAITTAGTISDIDGNLVLNDTVDIGPVATGINVTTGGVVSDNDGNLIFGDTADIGSATTGLRVSTDGVILDIDDAAVSVNDDFSITGDLTVTGGDIAGPSGENIDLGEATADTTIFYIASTGELSLDADYLYPTTDSGLSLGSSSNQFADLYLDGGNINLYSATDIDITDNSATSFTVSEASSNYLAVSTVDSSETVTFGNASTNPDYIFAGTGGTFTIASFDCSTNLNGGTLTADGSGLITCADDDGGAGAGQWVATGTVTHLTTGTNNVTVGSSNNLAKLAVDGDTDEIQFLIQGNGTQTSNLAVFEQSDGTDILTLTNSGALTLIDGGLLDLSNIAHDDSALQGLRLPQNTSLTALSSGEGFIAWDSDDDNIQVYNGSEWTEVSGGLWANTANVFHPKDEYADVVDLVLGGTATSSANVQFSSQGWGFLSGARVGQALFQLDETGNQNILTASVSGTTRFTLGNSGDIDMNLSTSLTTGNGLDIDWAGATTLTGAGSGLTITTSDITGNGQNFYGIDISDLGTAGGGNEYAIYQQGTDWDYGAYFTDDVYIGGTGGTNALTINAGDAVMRR
ncbi:MAG: MerR family DNA-binding transcriptional regulator [Candidatus Hermodarchaeia archaeon]|jgi:excisionase family DNA binding protein